MGRDLTPYMLAGGPILLMVAFFSWPQTNEVGADAIKILMEEERMTLMIMLMPCGAFSGRCEVVGLLLAPGGVLPSVPKSPHAMIGDRSDCILRLARRKSVRPTHNGDFLEMVRGEK